MRLSRRILAAQDLLEKTQEINSSQEEKELLDVAIQALGFIIDNGQLDEFKDYTRAPAGDVPSWIVAVFNTRAEAEVWLNASPYPRDLACVLIADEYHIVLFYPESGRRHLVRDPSLEEHIEELLRDGPPPAVASFSTREEAQEWFNRQADPPVQSVVQIGGELHLAVYYRNIPYRTFFPFSVVKRLETLRSQGK